MKTYIDEVEKLRKRMRTLSDLISDLFRDNKRLSDRNEKLEKLFESINSRSTISHVYQDISKFLTVIDE